MSCIFSFLLVHVVFFVFSKFVFFQKNLFSLHLCFGICVFRLGFFCSLFLKFVFFALFWEFSVLRFFWEDAHLFWHSCLHCVLCIFRHVLTSCEHVFSCSVAFICDLQGRKINFTNSETLVGW